ncbi:MAG: hypothetical protein AB1499_01305 [Nitrospirota bacterium]
MPAVNCAAANQENVVSSEMSWNLFIKIIGIAGAALILCGYYMLWISPDTELNEVIIRTRYAIVSDLSGALMMVFYLYKRHS